MRLLIDGDACPNKEELYQLALDYNIEMIVFCDYSHIINGEYETIYCDVGHDEVDQIIYKEAHRDDIITHVGEKTHGFNHEDDSPSLYYFCRNFID